MMLFVLSLPEKRGKHRKQRAVFLMAPSPGCGLICPLLAFARFLTCFDRVGYMRLFRDVGSIHRVSLNWKLTLHDFRRFGLVNSWGVSAFRPFYLLEP